MTSALALDYETHLIGPDVCGCGEVHGQFPPAVCFTWADDEGDSGIETPADALDCIDQMLNGSHDLIVGAETAFDVLVSCQGKHFDEWLHRWIQAYKAGRIRDVLVRARLLNNAAGRFEFHTHSDGNRVRVSHDLAGVAKDCCGLYLDKSGDTFRRRYYELDGVPFKQWPKEAIDYAQLDPQATGMAFEAQENWREHPLYRHIPELWRGKLVMPQGAEPDPFMSEHIETCHALWLKIMSGHVGVMIDPNALEQYESRVLVDYTDLCTSNRKSGLLRREYWRDQKGMKDAGYKLSGRLAWAEFKEALDVDDPDALQAWSELKEEGLVRWRHKRNTKAAMQKMHDICTLAGKAIPRSDGWDKYLKEHNDEEPPANTFVKLDADSCRLAGLYETELDVPQDARAMQGYSDLVRAAKIINTDIPKIRHGIVRPIHTHFTSLLATSRTSSSNPPLQNRDRGEDTRPGDRECFIPTVKGWVYIDIDFAQLELFCLAQVCKWLLGYSSMGDALLLGRDLHLDFAANILSAEHDRPITYEELDALKGDAKGFFKKARQAAKGANFGRPGGLGANTMVGYAAKSYGVYLPVEGNATHRLGWKELLKMWSAKWYEMPDYFDYVNSCETYPGSGEFLSATCHSGMLRAGAPYTASCNHNYQALGAVVAKLAGWYLTLACYERGVDPVLYGSGSAGGLMSTQCRPGHFVHDQFMNQVRRDRVDEALPRVEYWCRQAAIEVLPDYGRELARKTQAHAAMRWSKQAERIEPGHKLYDASEGGKVQIWEDARLFGTGDDE